MAPPVANLIALPSVVPNANDAYPHDDAEIASAISRAQENLLRQQHRDGHWCGELIVDSTLCSDYVLFMHWLGEVDDAMQQRCVRHILKRQLPDGGWNLYYGGPSAVKASGKAYFAMQPAARPAVLRLAEFLPARRSRPENYFETRLAPDAQTRARRSRALDAGTNRRGERRARRGFPGNAQWADCIAHARVFQGSSGLRESREGFRWSVR